MKINENSNAKGRELIRKSLVELYDEAKAQPTPAQVFVSELAQLTHKHPITVRAWLYGTQCPDSLTQSVIADHFGVEADGLFPAKRIS
jgi:hypothetical protein